MAAGTLYTVPISNRQLLDGEEVLLDMRPHWIVLAGPAILTVFALSGTVALAVRYPKAPIGVAWALAVVVALPAFWLLVRFAKRQGTSLIMTTARLILRRGVFGRDLVQLRLQRIVEVHYHQTLFERVVGTGRLIVDVNGENASIYIDDVRHPRRLQQALNRQMEVVAQGTDDSHQATEISNEGARHIDQVTAWTGQTTPPQGVPVARPSVETSGLSIPDQLVQLDELRRRGILTSHEFESKKAELLSRF